MTTNITVSANSARQAFLETADEEKIFQLSKTQLDLLATGALGANLSIKFTLIEEFSEGAGFDLEIRKSTADGALLTSVSSVDNASFSSEGELNLDINVTDDAPYYLIVKPSSADAYSEAQFEIIFDELPTFGGLVTDSSVSSEDIVALEEAYIGTDLDNTAEFTSISDKVSFLVDLKAADDDREIEIAYGGPSTTVEVFKLSDASSATAKNITNAAGSTGIKQSIGLIYTVTEQDNKLTISRTDGKEFTATFSIGGDNTGVTSIPDPVTSSLSSATFATALSGDASSGDIITLTLSSDNEADVTRTFTAVSATAANDWADKIVGLFSEDRVTFTANAAAETIKVVFSSPASVGTFDFSINALDDPSVSEEQNLASDVLLTEDQSHAPSLRINDTASSDFKMSQKVGAKINSSVTFTSGSDYALADFVIVDGDFDAVYLTLEKVTAENNTPALSITVGDATTAISIDPAKPTILSKADFLASSFTAGSSETAEYNLTVFARKLTGQNKSKDFTADSDVATWFATEPNQTDSSAILQAKVNYVATSITANILDNSGELISSSSSILEGAQGFIRVNVAGFTKVENEDTDLSINVSVSTNDISFINPSTGVKSNSKTQVVTDATLDIPFWAVSDPDLVAKETVALDIELIGSGSDYGQQLSSLYVEPVVFNVAELIPSLSTRYTNANALQPNDTNSVYQYEISLDNYADLKSVDDAILVKPVATSNASKFQVEAFTLDYDADNAELSIGRFAGTSDITATVSIDDEIDIDAYSNNSIDAALLYSKSIKIELASSDLPTSVYVFEAPADDASESSWSAALEKAFKGFKFEAAEDVAASQVAISVYSKASTDDETSSTLIEHELTYNGKTFDSVDLSIPNVQVTTNLAITETWTPSGTDLHDTFALNSTAASITAVDGNDTLSVSAIPTAKSSTFDGGGGEDTVEFDDEISQYTIELSSSGDVKIADLSSSGILYVKATENVTFGDQTYQLTRVDGTLSSYTGESGNDLFITSTSEPTVTDTGNSGQDILITTAPYVSSNYEGIEQVYLSGDENLSATLLSATQLHGNSGDNEIILSSENDIIFESPGLDRISDDQQGDVDTFVLASLKDTYTYYSVNDRSFITSAEGTSILDNIEKIAFANDLNNSELVTDLTDTALSSEEELEGISISVTGEHIEGSTLTAKIIDVSNGQSIEFSESFSWYEVGSSLAVGSGNTLELKENLIGKKIYAKVSYLDVSGVLRSATSTETPVTYFDDPTVGIVSLSGSTKVGGKITADLLSFVDPDFLENDLPPVVSYQWYRNGELLEGATQQAFEITQSLNDDVLSVELGFLNSYGDIEYLTSSDSSIIFEGRNQAPLSVSNNELFVVNSSSASIDVSLGAIKSDFTSFYDGEEITQYEDNIRPDPNLGTNFDSLKLDVNTSSSVIQDPDTAEKFSVVGREAYEKNLALFLDMSAAATGLTVDLSAVQKVFFKGEGRIYTDDSDQFVVADARDQIITSGAGNDTVFSGAGDDTLTLGTGYNVVYAGTGIDTVIIPFSYSDEIVGYSSTSLINVDNGVTAYSILDAEFIDFNGNIKPISELSTLTDKNFDPLGSVLIEGIAQIGSTLTVTDNTFDTNGIDSESVKFEWYRDGEFIEGQLTKSYVLSEIDVGSKITVKKIFEDNLGQLNMIESQSTESVQALRTVISGSNLDDVFTSTSDSERFVGGLGYDIFKFVKSASVSQGDDIVDDFDPNEDTLEIEGYSYEDILRTLDPSGNDVFEFADDPGESSVTISAATSKTQLRLLNMSEGIVKFGETEVEVDAAGTISLNAETIVKDVTLKEINSLKTGLKKTGASSASDPIDLSDVLSQLKHIVGLKALTNKAFHAGDTNNDGDVNLSDVLENLKHIVGLKEIASFDLVTENGFAINSLSGESVGNLALVINGDADQSHADWDLA